MHGKDELTLNFIASADAAGAVDAFGQIGRHVRMRKILLAIQMVCPGGIANFPYTDFRGDRLQFAIAVHFAGQTIQRVIGEDEFHDIFAQVPHLAGLRVNIHPWRKRSVAGGNDTARSVFHQCNLDGTDAAGAVG